MCMPGHARGAARHQGAGGRRGTDTPSEPPEGTSGAHTLTLDFQPQKREECIAALASCPVCGAVSGRPGRLNQTLAPSLLHGAGGS